MITPAKHASSISARLEQVSCASLKIKILQVRNIVFVVEFSITITLSNSVSQSVDRSIDRSIIQSINQPINRSRSVGRSVNQCIDLQSKLKRSFEQYI